MWSSPGVRSCYARLKRHIQVSTTSVLFPILKANARVRRAGPCLLFGGAEDEKMALPPNPSLGDKRVPHSGVAEFDVEGDGGRIKLGKEPPRATDRVFLSLIWERSGSRGSKSSRSFERRKLPCTKNRLECSC